MSVGYLDPLNEAFSRTRRLLFSPLDLGRWFVLGFTTWLIHLGSLGGSAAGNDPDFQARIREGDVSGAFEAMAEGLGELIPDGLAAMLAVALIAVAVLVGLVLLWVSCRARFVWLENLTHRHHRLAEPWSRLGWQGDAFFLWKLAYIVLLLLLVAPLAVFSGVLGVLTGEGVLGPGSVLGWIALGVSVFVVAVAAAFVDFFAESFVTVIMHRRGVGVLTAWREFGRLFAAAPGHFVLVGIVKFVLGLLVIVLITVFGLVTCCVGFLLVSLPYLGAVIQLPIHAVLRYFDMCWLGQFGGGLALPDDLDPEPVDGRDGPGRLPPPPDAPSSGDARTPGSDPNP